MRRALAELGQWRRPERDRTAKGTKLLSCPAVISMASRPERGRGDAGESDGRRELPRIGRTVAREGPDEQWASLENSGGGGDRLFTGADGWARGPEEGRA